MRTLLTCMAVLGVVTTSSIAQDLAPKRPDLLTFMRCEWPTYPAAAVRANTQGRVRFTVTVGDDSRVTAVEITGSSGETREHRLLDRTVQDTFMRCRQRADAPAPPGDYRMEYVFRLDP